MKSQPRIYTSVPQSISGDGKGSNLRKKNMLLSKGQSGRPLALALTLACRL